MKSSVRGIRKMSMTKIQKELLGALIGLARSVDGRGEAAKGESQEFSSGDSNGHRPDKEERDGKIKTLKAREKNIIEK